MNAAPTLPGIAAQFAALSLLAVGGANAVVPEMHRQFVETAGLISEREFADLFAIAQAAPGPNVIIVTLIGLKVAGLAGALTATLAMCGPTCVLAYAMGLVWERFKDAPWRIIIQAALVPLSVGFVAASALILARTAGVSLVAWLLIAATAGIACFTRLNPLWMFAIAALAGLAGLV
jgi:chromate transporter